MIMHRITLWVLFIFLVFTMVLFAFPKKSFAESNFNTGNTPTLPKSQTINEDYFTSGGTVMVLGTVTGDIYAAGGNVLINGTVNGDVLVIGGNVTVNGSVGGDVRVVGGQVTIGANVGKNVTTVGGSIAIQDPAKIAGSLVAVGGSISVLAPIGKGATFAGNQVTIDTAVGGNVNAGVQQLQVSSGSHIAGSLNYWSNTKANIPSGAVVKGVTYHYTPYNAPQNRQNTQAVFNGFNLVWGFISVVSAFIIGVLFLWLMPVYMGSITHIISSQLGTSLLIGLVSIIVIPIAFVFLLVTIVGIPLAFILLGVFMIWVYLNKIFISFAIGRKLLPEKNVLALLVGLVIYGVISIIPILGGIWGFVSLCVGLGAFILLERELYPQARAKKIF